MIQTLIDWTGSSFFFESVWGCVHSHPSGSKSARPAWCFLAVFILMLADRNFTVLEVSG